VWTRAARPSRRPTMLPPAEAAQFECRIDHKPDEAGTIAPVRAGQQHRRGEQAESERMHDAGQPRAGSAERQRGLQRRNRLHQPGRARRPIAQVQQQTQEQGREGHRYQGERRRRLLSALQSSRPHSSRLSVTGQTSLSTVKWDVPRLDRDGAVASNSGARVSMGCLRTHPGLRAQAPTVSEAP
jgi:hypothetical protein